MDFYNKINNIVSCKIMKYYTDEKTILSHFFLSINVTTIIIYVCGTVVVTNYKL